MNGDSFPQPIPFWAVEHFAGLPFWQQAIMAGFCLIGMVLVILTQK